MRFPRKLTAQCAHALVCAVLLLAAPAHAQQAATPDSTVPLFVVLAAVNAAGYDADLQSPHNSPVREQVRRAVAEARPPVLEALRAYYAAHRHTSVARDLSQFVSFALLIGGPPDFAFRIKEADLPREAAALKEFRPLLATLYAEAGIAQLWEKFRPEYERELSRYDEGLARVMLEVNGYLRIPSSTFLGRNFQVYVDLLGAPGQVNARSFGPDYYVVCGASPQPQLTEVRHGYLHYVLDAMTAKYSALIRSKNVLHAFADEAHALDPVLRKDFRLLVTESLIRAVELRMQPATPLARQQRLHDTLVEGHFLAPYFSEALDKFERQEAGMRLYITELLEKIDVGHEQKRLARVMFRTGGGAAGRTPHVVALSGAEPAAAERESTAAKAERPATHVLPPGATEEQTLIARGEDALARGELPQARESFQGAAGKKGALEGQAVYGLALVATLEGQGELAKTLFQRALQVTREPRLMAWAHVYLGRIFDMEKNRELAVKHYEQALAADSEPGVQTAARRGLEAPFRRGTPPDKMP